MIGFGFTPGKLGQVLSDVKFKGLLGNVRMVSAKELADFLVVLGTTAFFAGAMKSEAGPTRC
jgi:hypothetical protein